MRVAISKAEIESEIASRFGSAFKQPEQRPVAVISSGLPEVDSFTGGLPRGAITEIFGPASSGRTSFMLATLTHATNHDEVCALVDTSNVFDPASATRAEINCERLLWIRCANNLEHAFKATDLLLQGGGFGVVLLDLGDVPAKSARRIISSWWYRFRRTLEATPTALLVIAEDSCVRSCATLALELREETCLWSESRTELKTVSDRRLLASQTNKLRASVSAISIPAVMTPSRWDESPPSHANLLHGLNFQMECRRPLYLNTREQEVSVKVSHQIPPKLKAPPPLDSIR
jgi:recombination protein RecA